MRGIYTLYNLKNQKIYIGASTNIEKRKKRHFKDLRNKKHENKKINNEIKKYNIESFNFNYLLLCKEDEDIYEWEKYFIRIFSEYYNLYNINKGRDVGLPGKLNGRFGYKYTEEDRLNHSLSQNKSGFMNVGIQKNPKTLQGFHYRYRYRIGKKTICITSTEIYDIKQKVLKRKLPFVCLTKEAEKELEESKKRCLVDKYTIGRKGKNNDGKTMFGLRKNGKIIKRSIHKNVLEQWVLKNCTKEEIQWFYRREKLKTK